MNSRTAEVNRRSHKPYVLTLAGLDPCAGAGLAADLKTFEGMDVHGLCVCTALTYQNHKNFNGITWTSKPAMKKQLTPLLDEYPISSVKVGIIEGLRSLEYMLSLIKKSCPQAPVIWDPVLKASAGFAFHKKLNEKKLERLCRSADIITPNGDEARALGGFSSLEKSAKYLSDSCAVLVTGVRQRKTGISDMLYYQGRITRFSRKRLVHGDRHGSGCVLSAALAASLALGNDLESACRKAGNVARGYIKGSL
ncbi:PfkB family carbohydrate kinase [Fibrobacterota bacterium]